MGTELQIQESQKKELLTLSRAGINNLISIASQGGKLLSGRSGITAMQVITDKTRMTVGFICKQGGVDAEKQVASLYILVLAEASKLFPNNFDSESITATAYLLLNEYPMFKPEEITIFIRNGITGKYGKMYHQITTTAIMDWALTYYNERIEITIEQAHNKSFEENRINSLSDIESEKVKKEFGRVKMKATNNYINEQKEKDAAWKKLLNQLSNDFYALNKKQYPDQQTAIRFVDFKKEKMDFEQYMNTRIKEVSDAAE